jgi:hypothetical protein
LIKLIPFKLKLNSFVFSVAIVGPWCIESIKWFWNVNLVQTSSEK